MWNQNIKLYQQIVSRGINTHRDKKYVSNKIPSVYDREPVQCFVGHYDVSLEFDEDANTV